jgi:PAS domain S-box-containing protein
MLMVAVATGFVAVMLLGTRFLIRALREHRESEARFQQMASNIREIFWMIDAGTRHPLYVNEAYETITGRSCQSLFDNPTSYEELIHSEDRTRVLAKLDEATRTGQFNERFRIVSTHGEERGSRYTGFPCGTPQARFGGWLGPRRRLPNRRKQRTKSSRT